MNAMIYNLRATAATTTTAFKNKMLRGQLAVKT
jgi:hypothetical protein